MFSVRKTPETCSGLSNIKFTIIITQIHNIEAFCQKEWFLCLRVVHSTQSAAYSYAGGY